MSKHYQTLLVIVAISVALYAAVDIFYKYVVSRLIPMGTEKIVRQNIPGVSIPRKTAFSAYQTINERNLFGSTDQAVEKEKTAEIESLEPTSLKVELLGTITGHQQIASAVIEEKNKRKQGLYKVGDTIQNATLKHILRGKVVLRVGNKDEILEMKEPTSSKSVNRRPTPSTRESGSYITVRRSDLQKSLENLNSLLAQVRVTPHFKDGEADGLSLSNIKSNSIFTRLGLRNGDIVKGINGKPIEGPEDVMALYDNLKSGSRVSLELMRNGRQKKINYRFR